MLVPAFGEEPAGTLAGAGSGIVPGSSPFWAAWPEAARGRSKMLPRFRRSRGSAQMQSSANTHPCLPYLGTYPLGRARTGHVNRRREATCIRADVGWPATPPFPRVQPSCMPPLQAVPPRIQDRLYPGLSGVFEANYPQPGPTAIRRAPVLSQATRPSFTALWSSLLSTSLSPVVGSQDQPSCIHIQRRYARSSLSRGCRPPESVISPKKGVQAP